MGNWTIDKKLPAVSSVCVALFSLFSDERSSQTVSWGDKVGQEGLVGFEGRARVLFSSRIFC